MKKIIYLILMLFLITGCDATYNLTLENNIFTENLEITNNDKNTWNINNPSYKEIRNLTLNSALATDYREEIPEVNTKVEGIKYYDIKKIDTENTLGISYKSNFTLLDYQYSTIVNTNVKSFDYKNNNDGIIINIKKPLNVFILYPNLNNLTIKFKTNHQVMKNNADEIVNNTYYFYLNKNNYQAKKIILEISNDYKVTYNGLL
ncbi:MAG: hypothetical protein PHD03_04010, partial [Bacilli bacterium]|nr:hypothetical protein [Bacilli bacterium]MDD4407226.1 hypothetical protein [Bacilli bacterium]